MTRKKYKLKVNNGTKYVLFHQHLHFHYIFEVFNYQRLLYFAVLAIFLLYFAVFAPNTTVQQKTLKMYGAHNVARDGLSL